MAMHASTRTSTATAPAPANPAPRPPPAMYLQPVFNDLDRQVVCDISKPQWRDIITATGIPASVATVTRIDSLERMVESVDLRLQGVESSVDCLCQMMALHPAGSVSLELREHLHELLQRAFASGFQEGVNQAVTAAFEMARERDMRMIEDIVTRKLNEMFIQRGTGGAAAQHAVQGMGKLDPHLGHREQSSVSQAIVPSIQMTKAKLLRVPGIIAGWCTSAHLCLPFMWSTSHWCTLT